MSEDKRCIRQGCDIWPSCRVLLGCAGPSGSAIVVWSRKWTGSAS